ncbi:MAG: hypothetical protein E2O81_04750 [Betaproteobacteria bacterium]|nr:MAG: hypothetical protein E2O81_04750 [Betaproteobacteria bacterium]TDI79569.1 MAG: hypothetical protein E2O80_08290 [Betaproteobacteria bacterium]
MRMLAAIVMLWLAGCAGGYVPPDWQLNAHGALRDSVTAYLVGNSKLADMEFARTRAEIASTGRIDLLARTELVRCAAHVASLEFNECGLYQILAEDATDSERVYAEYLAGRWAGLNTALLPAQHRGVVAGADGALRAIKDPLSRLVAAGVLFQIGRLTPNGVTIATQTASDQGWRRPLLAWLGVAARSAEQLGDKDEALRIQRRIDLVLGVDGEPSR